MSRALAPFIDVAALDRYRGDAGRPVISYCGSGVTACHTLLVLEHAGFVPGRPYPGSWSQYAADPARPAATGE